MESLTEDRVTESSHPPDVEQVPPPPAAVSEREKECVHKTKTIQFLGRTTPVVLQNDNGPCPLLAICNVLLLRNNLNLSPDLAEVSQERLLSLVAERLIDSNSNVKDKNAGYIENQQQNVADAIDLLPRLATGIDVNIKFKRIDDFEFTPECAIFDLLDIPLYHGWIVDPQDHETAHAIGSKSYNAIMGELVALETQSTDDRPKTDMDKNNAEEDNIDFAAATTATLGVPSPLSMAGSFDSPCSVSCPDRAKKGDLEEEADLMMALKLSEGELLGSVAGSVVNHGDEGVPHVATDESASTRQSVPLDHVRNVTVTSSEDIDFSSLEIGLSSHQSSIVNLGESFGSSIVANNIVEISQTVDVVLPSSETISSSMDGEAMVILNGVKVVETKSTHIADIHKPSDISIGHNSLEMSGLYVLDQASDSLSGQIQNIDAPETLNSSVDGREPIYEGEECILGSATTIHWNEEPKYEGEGIKNFLKNNANQLTFYGLFCLQKGLKERELCVFFRNNHFSTMFKYEGQLYLLATDQGYINQSDLVWEKLNEVNGDTLFMTGNFTEFKLENNENETWDEQNAMTSTADYIASIDSAADAGLDMNSDLQLAIALQQQEFEQQQSQRRNPQQQAISGSGLITGPQRPSNSGRIPSSSSRPERKSRDKCIVL